MGMVTSEFQLRTVNDSVEVININKKQIIDDARWYTKTKTNEHA